MELSPQPRADKRADTDPPPGAAVLSPTLKMKSDTVLETSRFSTEEGKQYSIIRSLQNRSVGGGMVGD